MSTPQKPMPTPAKVQAPSRPQPINHPAVADYVQEWNRMAHELDALRKENAFLRGELETARGMINELQHISDHERREKEVFQRWAARCDTLAGEVARMAATLRDESQRAAAQVTEVIEEEPEPPAQLEGPRPPAANGEDEVAALARKFAPRPPGSNSQGG